MIATLVIRLAHALINENYKTITHLFPTHLRLDALFAGVLVAYFYHFQRERFIPLLRRVSKLLVVPALALLSPAFIWPQKLFWIHSVGLTCFYLASVMLLCFALVHPLPSGAVSRAITYLGARSYSVYLWHMPVIVWIVAPARNYLFSQGVTITSGQAILAYMILSFIVGVIAANAVELPVVAWRDRFFSPNASGRQS